MYAVGFACWSVPYIPPGRRARRRRIHRHQEHDADQADDEQQYDVVAENHFSVQPLS